MNRFGKWVYGLIDLILPPLKFKRDWFEGKPKKLSKAESDKWADDILAQLERRKRDKRNLY